VADNTPSLAGHPSGIPFLPTDAVRHLHVLCVARHQFLAEHYARFFRDVGVDATAAVGVGGAVDLSASVQPDVIVCEYDLLATVPLEDWEQDPIIGRTPVVAVSLTRRANEMHPLDVNGIAGFFYLPMLSAADAHRILHSAAAESLSAQVGRRMKHTASLPGTSSNTLGAR